MSDCWLTTSGLKTKEGYGIEWRNGKIHRSHRLAWVEATGEAVPKGLVIGHTCDNPGCVRNDDEGVYIVGGQEYKRRGHLWLTTRAANNLDRQEKGRQARGDANGSRLHPERIPRMYGDANGTRLHPERVPRMHGERNGGAKLSEAQVREIRAEYVYGSRNHSAFSLARQYGVGASTIYRIVNREAWVQI